MTIVNIHEAKTHLSRLLTQVENGEEVIIARNGKPVARLVHCPEEKPRGTPQFGAWKGKIVVPDDFDDPLPDDILALFYGEDCDVGSLSVLP